MLKTGILRTPPARAMLAILPLGIGYILWINFFNVDPELEPRVSAFFLNLPHFLFVCFAGWMIAKYPMEKRLKEAWTFLALSIAFMIIADSIFMWGDRPTIGLSDPFFFAFYAFFVLGVARFPFVQVNKRQESLMRIDLAVVLLSSLLLVSYLLAPSIVTWISQREYPELFNMVYPLLDLLKLACAATLIQRSVKGVHPLALVWVALSIGLFDEIANSFLIYATLHKFSENFKFPDTLYMILRTLSLMALAYQYHYLQTSSTDAQESRFKQVLAAALPYGFCAVVVILIALAAFDQQTVAPGLALVGVLGVIGLVFYRQQIVLRENTELFQKAEEARLIAEKATAAKAEFLARMSHEIRTPMHGVIGMTGVLLNGRLEDEQRDIAESIRGCGNSLLSIINEILDFSKIESGRMELQMRPFDFRRCVEEAFDPLRLEAGKKDLKLLRSIGSSVPHVVVGDAARLREILLNLLSNAVKFTEHGEVELIARSSHHGSDQHEFHISVRDTGIGIPEEQQQKLFQPFTQIVSATERQHGGTGLGLAISKKFCELMGGRMWIESSTGSGATFHFTFMARVESSSMLNQGPPAPLQLDTRLAERLPLRILVVEDNLVHQKVSLLMLKQLGYEAELARNGLEAVDMFRSHTYDLILMDMRMPGMDGLECARQIRKLEKADHPAIVIATTASVAKEDHENCLAAGMNDVLTKPLLMQSLQEALLRWWKVESPAMMLAIPDAHPDAFDSSRIAVLSLISPSDREDVLGQLVAAYLADSKERLQDMRKAATNKDWNALRFGAHALKGASAVLGIEKLANACAALEQISAPDAIDHAEALVGKIEKDYQAVCVELASVAGRYTQ